MLKLIMADGRAFERVKFHKTYLHTLRDVCDCVQNERNLLRKRNADRQQDDGTSEATP